MRLLNYMVGALPAPLTLQRLPTAPQPGGLVDLAADGDAVVATEVPQRKARNSCRIIHVVLKNGRPYCDRTADRDALTVKRNAQHWISMLGRYG
ncbi:MAG: hypothetical protein OXK82_02640 [Deltaproteobacteria bacterium]|nr:hypothetical protein [Deltaproteobacteria bacterium]